MQTVFSNALIQALGWTLVHSIWQGCVIAFVAAFLLSICRYQSARLRYFLAYSCLLCLFFATITTFFVLFRAENAENTEGGVLKTEIAAHDFDWVQYAANPSFTAKWVTPTIAFFNRHLGELAFAWLIGFLFFGLKLVVGWSRLRQWQRRGGVPLEDDFWQTKLRHFQRQLSIRRPIQLFATAWTSVPMTIGWLKPLVFIPIGMVNQLTAKEVEAILAHELVHIAEQDYLLNFVQAFIEVLFYFHPAVWWLSSVIRTEREMRCDEHAVRLCQNDALGYAKTLVRLQEHFQDAATPQLALAFNKKESILSKRVKNLFQSRTQQSTIMEKITITALLVGAFCAFGFMKNDQKVAFLPSYTEGVPIGKTVNSLANNTVFSTHLTENAAQPKTIVKENGFYTNPNNIETAYQIALKTKQDSVVTPNADAGPPNAKPDKCYARCKNPDGSLVEWKEIPCDSLFSKRPPNSKITEVNLTEETATQRMVYNPPPKPSNAQPGHCYAYCKNADGSAKTDWLETVCEDKLTEEFVGILIKKLKSENVLDASFSSKTITKDIGMAALAYQKKYNLPEGNLNLPTLKHMGIAMP